MDEIFGELARQSNTLTPVPPDERDIEIDLLIPLMDGEKQDQHEAELQMHSFVSEAQQTSTSTPNMKTIEKEDDTSSELT